MEMMKNATAQGVGDVSRVVNELRADELLQNLSQQNINLDGALRELQQVREFIKKPHIQGGPKNEHGIIAEHMEVHFNNADELVVGNSPTHVKEPNVASPVDYYENGTPIQAKFYENPVKTIDGINKHLEKYPDFLATQNGNYDIPKDYYEKIQEWRKLSPVELENLPSSDGGDVARKVIKKVNDFEKANDVNFEDVVNPTQPTYDEAQRSKAGDAIGNKEQDILNMDESERQKHEIQSRASLKEGVKVAAISAAIDGVLSFGTTVISKINQGKKLSEFTEDDWKDVFQETSIGVVRGGVTGGSIYALTNVTGMATPVAAAIVTATFGVAKQAIQLGKGNISTDDFIYNIQQLAADTAVSGIGAFAGQIIIPIPVVGAIVGSLVSTKILSLVRENLFGGSYYNLVKKAEYEAAMSSTYRVLSDSLEQSRQSFEDMVLTYASKTRQLQQLQQQDAKNHNKLNDLLEII